jgi:hypothetical protein
MITSPHRNSLEMFRSHVSLSTEVSIYVDNAGCNDAEEETETKHNGISNTNTQRSFASEEGRLSHELLKWGDEVTVPPKEILLRHVGRHGG